MSVCFFVPAGSDEAVASAEDSQELETVNAEVSKEDNLEQQLEGFWVKVMDEIKKSTADHFKTQALPLARIKKIMKLDEDVRMISSEAPVLFAKAAEIFIHELTLRAWSHTEDNKRRTLQRNDIAMALHKSDQFDFLIDIVPRQEVKINKVKEDTSRHGAYSEYSQPQSSQQSTSSQQPQQQHLVVQPNAYAQMVSQNSAPTASTSSSSSSHVPQSLALVQQVPASGELQQVPVSMSQHSAPTASTSSSSSHVPQSLALVQQMPASGELQQVPIQLTQAQLNMIRLQMQNNPSQPIIIQTQQQTPQMPQIIQVASQGQQPQQVYIAASQEGDS